MIIYLAARYSRRLELCGYRAQLQERGHQVPARWLNGGHQTGSDGAPLGETGERKFESGHPDADHLRDKFATDDLEDVASADMLIAFTEPPRANLASLRGRHVELGIAIGRHVTGVSPGRIAVIGPRENLFCWLPFIEYYPDWSSCLAAIRLEEAP